MELALHEEIISCFSFSHSCETTDRNLIKNLMQEGSDRDEEPVAQNYSSVARSARIYQSGIFRNSPRGIHYLFYVKL
ncbi:putative protein isoform X1 [Capsicum chacoense]